MNPYLSDMSRLPSTSNHTMWFTSENPDGNPGGAHFDNDGRKRRASAELPAGGRLDLVQLKGECGVIRRIWLTFFALRSPDCPQFLRGMRIEVTYDGAATPAVNVPVGDFFCQGLGRISTFENAIFSSPEGRSLVSCLPMPFRNGVRISLVNDSPQLCRKVYYEVDATAGDVLPEDTGYLHAHWRRERPTQMMQDFMVLPPVKGRGRFLGACFSVLPDLARYGMAWWGEGEFKIYLDGDKAHPTLCGTGTEDYIGTGWGQRRYAQLYQGSPIADRTDSEFAYAFYRLHLPDPVVFHREIRAVIQQIGSWSRIEDYDTIRRIGTPIHLKGGDLYAPLEVSSFSHFEREDDWSSICWFYLDRPDNDLPPPPSYEDRVAGLVPEVLREWKLLGPFPGSEPGRVSLDDEPPFPVDPAALASGGGGTLAGRPASADENGIVNLASNLGPGEWCLAYAMSEFESSCERPVTLACTSDDGIRIWLNGEQVYSNGESRPCSSNLPDRFPVRLRRGRNHLLAKITNHTAGWAFGIGFKCPIRHPD